MIRTLIMDDDALVRANLSSLLDWESCGYHIVHDCINGLQALDYLRLHDVDLLITDIKMPGIGGLQLLEQLRASARLPVSVVLSGYDEFELVRDAFRLGAYDYLLKANLNEHTLRRLLDDLRDKVFHEAAAPGTGRKEELSLPPGRYIAAAFSVQNFAQVAQRYGGDLRERMQRPMLELARQIPRVSARAAIRAVDPSYYELYYQAADPFRAESGMDLAVRQICRVWKDMMNLEVSVGISGVIPHTQIPEAARQCGQLCRLAALRGPGAVCGSLRYGSLAHRCEQEAAACAGLVEAVCGGSGRDAQRQTSLWFVDLRRQEGEAHTARCAALLLGLEQKLQLSGQSLATVLPERQDLLDTLLEMDSSNDRELWLQGILRRVQSACAAASHQEADPMARARVFIQDNLINPELTLKTVADHVGFNEKYFSSRFAKEYGCTFISYLNALRIERASQLLLQTDMKIYEVCEASGYHNVEHFNQVFKKKMGTTPKLYRQSKKNT